MDAADSESRERSRVRWKACKKEEKVRIEDKV